MIPVGTIIRYGKRADGKPWHSIDIDETNDLPVGTPLYLAPQVMSDEGRALVAAAVNPDAGYIDHYTGSYHSERTKCTGCDVQEWDWLEGTSLDHTQDCPWVAQQSAINQLRKLLIESKPNE